MKKLLFALFIFGCATAVSAQTNLSTPSKSETSKMVKVDEKQEKEVKEAIKKDESLQTEVINHLKSEKATASAIESIEKANNGDQSAIIKNILGDKKLAQMAIDYVQDNPELLKKAMSIVGKK